MDTLATLGRTGFALVAVLGLMWLVSRWLRRTQAGRTAAAGELTVLSRTAVGHKAGVAVVAVGGRALVVGVTEASVSLLADLPADDLAAAPGAQAEAREVLELPAELTAGPPDEPVPATRAARRAAEAAAAQQEVGRRNRGIEGSAVSPQTWAKAVDVLRERTTRR